MLESQSRWVVLAATTWIQAFTGTNFDFSSYSTSLKSVLGITQVQLNYLSMASDMGKVFGWCSGVSLMYFPLWVVMFIAAFLGLFAYGLQWLVIREVIALPCLVVFLLCLVAGCSICWFNTVCFVLCTRNFPANRTLALSLTMSYNGVTGAIYTLIANAINPEDETLYLLLNSVLPLVVSGAALFPILHQPALQQLSSEETWRDSVVFLVLNISAVITGFYLLFLNSLSSVASTARILLGGAIILVILPLFLPVIVNASDWCRQSSFGFASGFNLVDTGEPELFEGFIEDENDPGLDSYACCPTEIRGCLSCFGYFNKLMKKDRLTRLGEEHSARMLLRRLDFWLYYLAYFCGGTIGLVYSNNLGQIAQSLGFESKVDSYITLYSSCSFFGRLLSAAPDFLREKTYFARTGWFAIALIPTPIAFFTLVASGSATALSASTALIGLSSGFIFATAVSVTVELFGENNLGVNHNILITNIPIGSLIYGLLAAIIYDNNATQTSFQSSLVAEMVCMGRKCYLQTFAIWGCFSCFGLVSSFALFLRTRHAYNAVERNRNRVYMDDTDANLINTQLDKERKMNQKNRQRK